MQIMIVLWVNIIASRFHSKVSICKSYSNVLRLTIFNAFAEKISLLLAQAGFRHGDEPFMLTIKCTT